MEQRTRPAARGGLLAWLCLCLACGGGSGTDAPPADPVIDAFGASPGVLLQGERTVLRATFHGGTGVVEPGALSIASGTPLPVLPAASATYTLTVSNGAGRSVQRTTEVRVLAAHQAAGGITSASGLLGSLSLRFAALPAGVDSGPAIGALILGGATVRLEGTVASAGTLVLAGGGHDLTGTATLANGALQSVSAAVAVGGGAPGSAATLLPMAAVPLAVEPTTGLPGRRAGATATSLPDGRILVVGGDMSTGSGQSVDLADALVWSPETRSYAATGAMHTGARFHHRVATWNGRVWFFGGTQSRSASGWIEAVAAVESWDPAAGGGQGAFTVRTPLRHARTDFALLQVGSEVYCFGGYDASLQPVAAVEAYDMAGNAGAGATRDVATLAHPRYGAIGAALPGGKLMVAGGFTGAKVKNFRQRLANATFTSELLDPATGTLSAGPDLPATVLFGEAVALGGRVLFFGSFGKTGPERWASARETSWFDPATSTFSAGPPLQVGRAGAMAAGQLLDGSVVVAGGMNVTLDAATGTYGGTGELDSVEILGPLDASGDPGAWTLLATRLSGGRDNFSYAGGAVSTRSGEFLIPGGSSDGGTTYVSTADVVRALGPPGQGGGPSPAGAAPRSPR